MFFNILILILLCIRPIRLSFISRVKNRYEYLPHEDTEFSTEDLYEFPVRIYEDFLPEPKNIVPKKYDLSPDRVNFELHKTTEYNNNHYYSLDKLRKTIENYENEENSYELQRKTTEYNKKETYYEKLRLIKNEFTTVFDKYKNETEVL